MTLTFVAHLVRGVYRLISTAIVLIFIIRDLCSSTYAKPSLRSVR